MYKMPVSAAASAKGDAMSAAQKWMRHSRLRRWLRRVAALGGEVFVMLTFPLIYGCLRPKVLVMPIIKLRGAPGE